MFALEQLVNFHVEPIDVTPKDTEMATYYVTDITEQLAILQRQETVQRLKQDMMNRRMKRLNNHQSIFVADSEGHISSMDEIDVMANEKQGEVREDSSKLDTNESRLETTLLDNLSALVEDDSDIEHDDCSDKVDEYVSFQSDHSHDTSCTTLHIDTSISPNHKTNAIHSLSNDNPLTYTSSKSNDSPIIDYVRYSVSQRRTRKTRHQRSHSDYGTSPISPSPSKIYCDIGDGTIIEDEIFWEFKLPAIQGGTHGQRRLQRQSISSNTSTTTTTSTSIDKLFFFGNRLWRITFGHHNVYYNYYYVFLSLVEYCQYDCYVNVTFTIHPFDETNDSDDDDHNHNRQYHRHHVVSFADRDDDNRSVASTQSHGSTQQPVPGPDVATHPHIMSSNGSFTFPTNMQVSRGFEKFITLTDLQGYISRKHYQPRIRMSVTLRSLQDSLNRLLPI